MGSMVSSEADNRKGNLDGAETPEQRGKGRWGAPK